VTPPLAFPTAEDLARLTFKERIELAPGMSAYAVTENGRLAAVGVVSMAPPPPIEGLIPPFVAVLVVLLVVAIGFARHLARPLARIAEAARRFGQGELGARTEVRRRDEIGEVGRAFDEMADRVTGLMAAREEMLANVSHELRTPLARMRVALDLVEDGQSDAAREILPELTQDLGELERLLDDVMDLSRLELSRFDKSTAQPLRWETLAPAELVEKAVSRFRARHESHLVLVEIAPDLPSISADPVLLRRVIENLLDNARKYADAGSTIRIAAAADKNGVMIEVEDKGIGMDESDLQQVFTPFFRSDRSRSRKTGGVGLGLALAQRGVEAHGGTIGIRSSPGVGTTVTIRLKSVVPPTRRPDPAPVPV
jgi:signal transduction histidine kinase